MALASPKSSPPQPRDLFEISLGSNQISQKSYKSTQIHYTGFKFIRENNTTREMKIIYLFFVFIESYYMKKSCLQLKSEANRRQQCSEAIKGNDTILTLTSHDLYYVQK